VELGARLGRLPHPGKRLFSRPQAAQDARGERRTRFGGATQSLCGRRTRRGGMEAAQRPALPPPRQLLVLLLLLRVSPSWSAAAPDPVAAARLSLHPPYFNLAEAARIWATATCGERGPGVGQPRPELYCKLVGGPTVKGGGHTIQVVSP
jgi:hypothetical protein